jgi:hypothetical protein
MRAIQGLSGALLSPAAFEALVTGAAGQQDALVGGFERGLMIAALFAAANIVMALGAPRLRPTADQMAEAAAAA